MPFHHSTWCEGAQAQAPGLWGGQSLLQATTPGLPGPRPRLRPGPVRRHALALRLPSLIPRSLSSETQTSSQAHKQAGPRNPISGSASRGSDPRRRPRATFLEGKQGKQGSDSRGKETGKAPVILRPLRHAFNPVDGDSSIGAGPTAPPWAPTSKETRPPPSGDQTRPEACDPSSTAPSLPAPSPWCYKGGGSPATSGPLKELPALEISTALPLSPSEQPRGFCPGGRYPCQGCRRPRSSRATPGGCGRRCRPLPPHA